MASPPLSPATIASTLPWEPRYVDLEKQHEERLKCNESIGPALRYYQRHFLVSVARPMDADTSTVKQELRNGLVISEEDCILRKASLPPKNFTRRSPGEVQIVFHDYVVREGTKSLNYGNDDTDESENDSPTAEEREESLTARRSRALQKMNWAKARTRESYGAQSYQKYEYDTYEVIPLQYLYKELEMDYMRFPPEIEKPSGLRIIEFPACYFAEDFLKAMSKRADIREPMDLASSVLASKTLKSNRYNPNFKTGVSIRASFNPNHLFTLFISIPYFGEPPSTRYKSDGNFKGDAAKLTEYREGYQLDWWRESLNLFDYRFRGPSSKEGRRDNDKIPEQGAQDVDDDTNTISNLDREPMTRAEADVAENGSPIGPGEEAIKTGRKRNNVLEQDVLVHQAWFIVLDNHTMGIFRSADDQTSDHDPQQPLFSHQERVGAFRALVHAMSNIFKYSEGNLLDIYYDKASRLDCEYHELVNENDDLDHPISETDGRISEPKAEIGDNESHKTGSARNSSEEKSEITAEENIRIKKILKEKQRVEDERRKQLNCEKKKLLLDLDKVVADIYIMISVVQSQIQILQDLREVYHVSFRKKLQRSVDSTVKVPVISKHEEQIRAAVRTVDVVIEGRKAFCKTLDDLLKDFQKLYDSVKKFVDSSTANEAEKGAKELMERQANTMSMFTLVTSLFLPLGFFSSYAAMDPVKDSFKTQGIFWAITGPATAIFMLMTLWIILHKKGEIRGVKRSFGSKLRELGLLGPKPNLDETSGLHVVL